jgi:hypothetical protein
MLFLNQSCAGGNDAHATIAHWVSEHATLSFLVELALGKATLVPTAAWDHTRKQG